MSLPVVTKKNFIFYSDEARDHDRITQIKGDFERSMTSMNQLMRQDNQFSLTIPVVPRNFFKISRIAGFLLTAIHWTPMQLPDDISVTPLNSLPERLNSLLGELKTALRNTPVTLLPPSDKLIKLLELIALRSKNHDERLLLRVLGLLCDTVFTGPMRLLIDPTPLCNLDCLYCRAHSPLREEINRQWKSQLKNPFLDFALFKNIIDDAVSMGVSSILVVGGGDPTAHPQFTEMCEYIGAKQVEFNVSTNGLLLNERIARAMAQLPSGSLTCSVSAATPETFARLHPGRTERDFHKLLDKLRMFQGILVEEGCERIMLKLLFVITQYNLHEIVPFLELAHELQFHEVWYQLVHIDPQCAFLQPSLQMKPTIEAALQEAERRATRYKIRINSYIDFQLEHLDHKGHWSKSFFTAHGCNVGWQFVYVSYEGDVSFCCGLKIIDRITESRSLKDIWYSYEYNTFRVAAKAIHKPENAQLQFKNNKTLYDDFCNCCDNHNFNQEMIQQIVDSGFGQFLEEEKVALSGVKRLKQFLRDLRVKLS